MSQVWCSAPFVLIMDSKKKERWKWVPGYEKYYKVSNLGRVKSVDRRVLGRNNKIQLRRGRFCSVRPMVSGHLLVQLSKHGHAKDFCIHQLVMRAFVGPHPKGLMVCHNDGNPVNNKLTNLRYDTNQSNQMDRHRHGTAATGMKNHNSLLTNRQVAKIRKLYSTGNYTYKQLGERFDVDLTTIGDVVRYRTYKNVGKDGEELDHTMYHKYNGNAYVGKKYKAFGKKLSLAQWSKRVGIPVERLRTRINKGWKVERALTKSVA